MYGNKKQFKPVSGGNKVQATARPLPGRRPATVASKLEQMNAAPLRDAIRKFRKQA